MAKIALLISSLRVFSQALHRLQTSLMPLLGMAAGIKTDPEIRSGEAGTLQRVGGQRELVSCQPCFRLCSFSYWENQNKVYLRKRKDKAAKIRKLRDAEGWEQVVLKKPELLDSNDGRMQCLWGWVQNYPLEYSFQGGSVLQKSAGLPNNRLTPTHVAVLLNIPMSPTRQCCMKQQPLHIFPFSMSVGLQEKMVSSLTFTCSFSKEFHLTRVFI